MSVTIYNPPYGEAVGLVEMKNHVKADADITIDDLLISVQTAAAREAVETATGANVPRKRVMLVTTFDLSLPGFGFHSCIPGCSLRHQRHLHVPRIPIVSIVSITYVDFDGNTQTLDASKYFVIDAQRGIIGLVYGEIWPSTRCQENAVTVRFIAGMAVGFTAVAATDVLTAQGRTFSNDDRVQLLNTGGALPAGLSPLTTYFVVNSSGSTFKLSLTSGGAAIDVTDTGSGTNFVLTDVCGFQALRSAMMLLVGLWYLNREAAVLAPGIVSVNLPMGFASLISSVHA